MTYTMKLWDNIQTPNEAKGPWLRSRFKAVAFDQEGHNVATVYTDQVQVVNALGRVLAVSSGKPVRVKPLLYNVTTREWYDTTSGRGLTYDPVPYRGDL